MLRRLRRDPGPPSDASLGREADASLRRDPDWLSDARRLGALHARLGAALGEADAAAALLQAGCLHGLRDAAAMLAAGWHGPLARCGALHAPRLSLALAPTGRDAFEVAGGWRETHEAEGRLSSLGRGRGPSCFASSGYVSGWLSGILGADVLALETACAAAGAPSCLVRARPAAAWRASGDARALDVLARLDFADLRASVAEDADAEAAEELDRSLDGELPVVHVWGPVMILPFSGAEDSIATLESVGRDHAARDVSVVVLDLAGALLDRPGGALALERVLDAVEQRGADAVLAGVAPRAEALVGELAARRGVLRRELPAAIAAAFQIADARRRPC